MDQSKLKVEPAGKTEGDWLAATPSSTELPEYVDGEFAQLIKQEEAEASGVEPAGMESDGDEEDELVRLERHMNALLEAGGRASLKERLMHEISKFRGR